MKKKKKHSQSRFPTPPISSRELRGKYSDQSTVAYRLTVPVLPHSQEEDFFSRLAHGFLSFLEKESKKEREGVFFGGMNFEIEESSLLLLYAFCPFSQRDFRPFARLTFNEEGSILDVSYLSPKKRLL